VVGEPHLEERNQGDLVKRSIAMLTAVVTGSSVLLAGAPAQATAHGRNGRIAFLRYHNVDRTRGDFFTISPDGTGERRVTHSRRTRLPNQPDWSPNGRWIEYQVSPHGDVDHSRMYKIRRNGSHIRNNTTSVAAENSPDWGPRRR
jgi:hypothetical protein